MDSPTVSQIDSKILTINKAICRHIDTISNSSRGAVSQDILAQLRNFVEHIMLKFLANGQDIENAYPNIQKAIEYVKTKGDLKVLSRFHDYLQIVASHYTLDEENSERLMLKYYEYLLKIKILINERLSLEILENLNDFPLNIDSNLQEYYEKIAYKIINHQKKTFESSEKYYIQKIKPFFVNNRVYYEVTFSPANDYASKFDRVIAFTEHEILDNYAVKLNISNESINVLGKNMPIKIIEGWQVSIRECEYKNFVKIATGITTKTSYSEQKAISNLLTATGLNLTELIDLSEARFQTIKSQTIDNVKNVVFFTILDYCRDLIQNNKSGSNILRYLLFKLNNKIIKSQYFRMPNLKLSGLYIKNGSIPFDRIPFNFSPKGHNPKLSDLFASIKTNDRKHEILARLIRNNTEIKGQLFTPLKEIDGFENLQELVNTYNNTLWPGHYEDSKLVIESGHIYINSYKKDVRFILNKLEESSNDGVENYSNSVIAWMDQTNHGIDCEEKKKVLVQIFENSKVALLYGAAGTGKSTLINHIAHFFSGKKKLFLAQTNPAVDNLKRKVVANNSTYNTITKFIRKRDIDTEYDLLIIDECSTVNNRDMKEILLKANFKLLVLVGDTYQIDSIEFGNWFSLAKTFIPKRSIYELLKPHRTNNEGLLKLWEKVRVMDDKILEVITKQDYSVSLSDSIFDSSEEDEIILCLNYDGLYGINNVNLFLQESNPSEPVTWGIQQFKINDPILFNKSERFSPLIYNNMKGKIVGIKILDGGTYSERIQFDIELEKVINGIDVSEYDLELLQSSNQNASVIRFCVNKLKNVDEDDEESSESVIPFQVSYAVSIHKAQGLEYNSVKIIIPDSVDELITHNIFYTAITRARNKLKIYWKPEVEKSVLSKIKPKNYKKDIHLLKNTPN